MSIVPTVERALNIADAAAAERCVVCDAVAECSLELEPAAGAALDEDAAKLVGEQVRACRACEQHQVDAKKYARRTVLVAIFAMPAVALACGILARRPNGIGAILGAVAAFACASIVLRVVLRRRARRVPLLLLGADEDSMLVQVNAPAPSTARSAYREPATAPRRAESPATPRPPRASFAMPWVASLMGSLAICGIASTGALSPTRVLVIDSPHHEVKVTIDDVERIKLAAGGRSVSRMRSGTHTYRVEYVATGRRISGSLEIGVMADTLLTTDATQCYLVWVAQGSRVTANDNGPVSWTRVADARSSERCE